MATTSSIPLQRVVIGHARVGISSLIILAPYVIQIVLNVKIPARPVLGVKLAIF